MIQHIKCPCAELLHDQLRHLRPDTLYHAGRLIAALEQSPELVAMLTKALKQNTISS